MTICSSVLSRTAWAGTGHRLEAPQTTTIPIGRYTPSTIHRCCVRPRCENLWSDLNCFASSSGILLPNRPRTNCVNYAARSTTASTFNKNSYQHVEKRVYSSQ
uniref:(northern house mosquito) hypothetical protein n=1 Tax=Culex pipiens TaxID=7175 RepID=A0A8D8FV63_CULPI